MGIFDFTGPFISLFIPIAIIVAIVMLVRRGRDDSEPAEPGIGTTRRIFLYGLAFISLMLATSGVTYLISSILDSTFETRIGGGGNTEQAAFGLAAVIVGLPIWLLLRRAADKSLETYPAEAGSLGRKFYAYFVLFVSAAVVATTGTMTLRAVLGWDDVDPSRFSAPIVWAVVWLFHWRMEASEGQPSYVARVIRRLYVHLTSAYGLIMLAVGTGMLLHGLLANAYAALFGNTIVGGNVGDLWNDYIQWSLTLILVGGAYWWFHWHRVSGGEHGSEFGIATIYVLGIFGGMVTAISGVSIAVFTLLKWPLDPGAGVSAARHFDTFPAAIAVTLVGIAIWFYHRSLAEESASQSPENAASGHRVYRYLSSAVGLAAMSVGIAVLLAVVIGFVTTPDRTIIGDSRWWGTPLAAALTSLIVGAPLWVRHWVLRQMPLDDAHPTERVTQSRRAYMFIVFGVAVLATLISGSIVLFQILRAALEGNLGVDTFDGVRYGIGVVLTAGIVSFYHWQVLREDRAYEDQLPAEAGGRPRTLRLTAVAIESARPLARTIAEQAGATATTFWTRTDAAGAPSLTEAQIAEAAARVSEVGGEHVLITIDNAGVQVIPL